MKSVCVTLFLVLTVDSVHSICPFGWIRFSSSCYLFHRSLSTWIDSSTYCRSHGAHLATVQSGSEKDFINGMIQNMPGGYWLDGVDDAAEGIWEWASTGQKISINLWYPGEPNQMTSLEDCMDTSAYYNGLWNDEECNKDNFCICEKPHV
ncbi:C-type lectin domain family 17, member A-like [Mytilus galloprovincialis]|uniref:C-type lectin domain family 17, member A-like n=1 Tax=Mytilus galloprovincialis TaxID=29158 RepID=UPI003F7BEF37